MTMQVDLIQWAGTDLVVVNAARVSFDKESEWERQHFDPITGREDEELRELSDKDVKLISYLAKHNHWTPFGHCTATFRIKAPIFVARQLGKHQVGLVWNEVSRRYVDSEPEFYVPEVSRMRADNAKQGSSDEEVTQLFDDDEYVCRPSTLYEEVNKFCFEAYDLLLKNFICPEQARMVLPQSMYTEWYWTGSLAAFARVCKLRLDPHSQKETKEVAKMISDHCYKLWPVSWVALNTEAQMSPTQAS